MIGTLENSTGDPAMTLVEIGISTVEVRKAVVLGIQQGREVGGIVDRVRVRPTGKQLDTAREAFSHRESKRVIKRISR